MALISSACTGSEKDKIRIPVSISRSNESRRGLTESKMKEVTINPGNTCSVGSLLLPDMS